MRNFHNKIALQLEELYSKKYMGDASVSADEIDGGGKFVRTMLAVLMKIQVDPIELVDFGVKCKPYDGQKGFELPEGVASGLFEEFKTLVAQYNSRKDV
jgi:hypothetical protein